MCGLIFLVSCGGQEQSYSSYARMVCQDQIIENFSQLNKKKTCGIELDLFLQVWLLLLLANTKICDLAQSMIILVQSTLL